MGRRSDGMPAGPVSPGGPGGPSAPGGPWMPATVAMTLTSATSARTLISGVGWRRMMLSRDVGITFHLALGEGHRLFVLGDPLDVPHALEYVLVGDESRRLG